MSNPYDPEYYDTEVSHAEATEDCPHDNVSYDPGNYIPPFGWEQRPGMFCDDCGEQMEEEDITYDIQWGDPNYDTYERYELEEEARNPL